MDGQWLSDFDAQLRAYRSQLEGTAGDEAPETGAQS